MGGDEAKGEGASLNMPLLLDLYRQIVLIRKAEERLITLFADGEVPGFIHLGIGQEAISAGVMAHLGSSDTIASTHRGHGHALAKGISIEGFFAELMAKEEGLCKGRGGSMHVADMAVGMLGANGIVGAGLSIALGSALAHQILGSGSIAVAFFGDAAMAEGLLHESMNIASLWSLPILFVCENNGWGEFLPSSKQISFKLADLAAAHGISHVEVDGNDVSAVFMSAGSQIDLIRSKGRPAVLECRTTRVRGHFEGDPQKYRSVDEMSDLQARDPLNTAARQLAPLGIGESALAELHEEADRLIGRAVEAARRGTEPQFAAAMADVYTGAAA